MQISNPPASRWRHWPLGEMARDLYGRFREHHVTDQSALLAFYFLFALFPLLLSVAALIGFFAEPGAFLHQALTQYLGAALPASSSGMIEKQVTQFAHGANFGKLSIGVFISLWSASSGMSALIQGLNMSRRATESRPWWREKLLAVGLTLAVSVLMLLALAAVIYGGPLAAVAAGRIGLGPEVAVLLNWLQWPLLGITLVAAFGIVFYFAPNGARRRWQQILPGAIVGVAVWILVSCGLRLYLHFYRNFNVAYGSIGAIIALMLWFYLTGIAMLLGGEVNATVENTMGKGPELA